MAASFDFRATSARRRLSLTPLVDVVFILLLFFMLSSRFEVWQGLAVNTAPPPPAVPEAQASSDAAAVLRFSADGGLSLDGKALTRAELSRELRLRVDADSRLNLAIVPGSGLNVQELMQVVDLARAAGVAVLSVGKRVDKR